jgi:hypothetical protein
MLFVKQTKGAVTSHESEASILNQGCPLVLQSLGGLVGC